MKEALGYARFSPRRDADESQSNVKQAERITEYCGTKNYRLLDILYEPDTSGAFDENNTDPMAFYRNRPVLYDALDRLKRGMVFVVRWRHRVARSVHAQGLVRMEITRKRCDWEATDEGNGITPEDKMMQQMFAAFSELQRQQTIIATKRAMERYQKQGRRMGRIDALPYGMMPDPRNHKRMIPHPEEQKVIAFMKAMHDQGEGVRAICATLDTMGYTRRSGKTWASAFNLCWRILSRLPPTPPPIPTPSAPSVATINQGPLAVASVTEFDPTDIDAIC